MSRSRHQHHPSGRKTRFKTSRGPWKMKPHGFKPQTGYGGEVYFHNGTGRYSNGLNGEYLFPVINKTLARKKLKPKDILMPKEEEFESILDLGHRDDRER